jgi:hypothetical protein
MPGRLCALTAFIVMGLAVGLAGCASHGAAEPEFGQRLAFSGYSVMPPAGPGWSRLDPPGTDAGFYKTVGTPDHRLLLVASARPLPVRFKTPQEFLDYLIAAQESEPDARRFHVLSESINLDPAAGPDCARTSASAEDRSTRLILDATSLVCIHPSAPGLLVTVAYSEQHRYRQSAPGFAAEGERFIGSLRFFDQ